MADSSDHQMEGVEDATLDKGKGKALQVHDASMESAEDDSSDESAAEEQVCHLLHRRPLAQTSH
jgi:hypothetical protein